MHLTCGGDNFNNFLFVFNVRLKFINKQYTNWLDIFRSVSK